MKNGNRNLATALVTKMLEGIKRLQLERYHKTKLEEDKNEIELNPFTVFHQAVDNCTPILYLVPYRKGGITYQVIYIYIYIYVILQNMVIICMDKIYES